jgi:hypothetical protein
LSSCDWDPRLFSGVRISIVGMEGKETFCVVARTDLDHKRLESFQIHDFLRERRKGVRASCPIMEGNNKIRPCLTQLKRKANPKSLTNRHNEMTPFHLQVGLIRRPLTTEYVVCSLTYGCLKLDLSATMLENNSYAMCCRRDYAHWEKRKSTSMMVRSDKSSYI